MSFQSKVRNIEDGICGDRSITENLIRSFNCLLFTDRRDKDKKYEVSPEDALALYENAKIIIVGTLTPYEGRDQGFYYTSPKNMMLRIIGVCGDKNDVFQNISDEDKYQIFKENNYFESLKKDPKKIMSFLMKKKVAFLDVIDEATDERKLASDDAIRKFTLDFNAFKYLFPYLKGNVLLIPNSKNAKVALDKILESVETPNNVHAYQKGKGFISQMANRVRIQNRTEYFNSWREVFCGKE